jgi:hypothetical protein
MPTIDDAQAALAAVNLTFQQLSTELQALTAMVNQIVAAPAPSLQFDNAFDSQDIPII